MRLMDSMGYDAEAAHAMPGGIGNSGTAFSAYGFHQAAGNGNGAGLHTSTQHSASATQAQIAPAVKKVKLSKGKTTTKKVGPLPCAATCWRRRHVVKPDSRLGAMSLPSPCPILCASALATVLVLQSTKKTASASAAEAGPSSSSAAAAGAATASSPARSAKARPQRPPPLEMWSTREEMTQERSLKFDSNGSGMQMAFLGTGRGSMLAPRWASCFLVWTAVSDCLSCHHAGKITLLAPGAPPKQGFSSRHACRGAQAHPAAVGRGCRWPSCRLSCWQWGWALCCSLQASLLSCSPPCPSCSRTPFLLQKSGPLLWGDELQSLLKQTCLCAGHQQGSVQEFRPLKLTV